jgi:hypothetical protein
MANQDIMLLGQKAGQLDVVVVDRRRRRHILVLHVVVGCVYIVGWSPAVATGITLPNQSSTIY